MPGYLGGLLLSNLLSATAPDNTNDNPAAGAHTVTPDMLVNKYNSDKGTSYKSSDEVNNADPSAKIPSSPLYISPSGQDVTSFVKSPSDLLPMQKPNFWTRFANPQGASRADATNAQYQTEPLFAAQQHNTQLGLAGSDAATARGGMDKPIGQMTPQELSLLSGGRNDAGTMSDLAGQVAKTRTGSTIAALNAQQLQDIMLQRRLLSGGVLRNPEQGAATEASGYPALQAENLNATKRATLAGILGTPEQQATVENLGLNNESFRQTNNVPTQLSNDYRMQLGQSGRIPFENNALDNESKFHSAMSQYGPKPPGVASTIHGNDVTYGLTGMQLSNDEIQQQLLQKSLGVDGSGKVTGMSPSGVLYHEQPSAKILPEDDKPNPKPLQKPIQPEPIQGGRKTTGNKNAPDQLLQSMLDFASGKSKMTKDEYDATYKKLIEFTK